MTLVREFNLYLTAGRTIPLVINVNQFDSGEEWHFTLFKEDGTQYIPSTGAIVGIKSDGLGIINSGTVVDGKVVINETQQMTAAVGKATFELTIDSGTHGTANFVVLVEEKPGNNADLSDSDISLIQEALNAVSPLPTGGTVGQVLTKTANGSAWSDAGTPTQEQVAEAVSDWADENITVETGVVIDQSLSVQGAAADAKKTGDEISDLKSALTSLNLEVNGGNIEFSLTDVTNGKYMKANGDINNNSALCYGFVDVGGYEQVIVDTSAFADTVIINTCDSNKSFVQNIQSWANPNKYTVTFGDNIKYICVSAKQTDIGNLSVYIESDESDSIVSRLTSAENDLDDVKNDVADLQSDVDSALEAPKKIAVEIANSNRFNFFDENNLVNAYITNGAEFKTNANDKSAWVKLEPNTLYMLSVPKKANTDMAMALFNEEPVNGSVGTNYTYGGSALTEFYATFKTTNEYVYFAIKYWANGATTYTAQEVLDSIKIEISNGEINTNIISAIQNAKHVPSNAVPCLALVHFSDLHGDQGALARIGKGIDVLGDLVDDSICTGDIAGNSASQISSWWNSEIMTCIGNHDSATYSGGSYNWTALSMSNRDAYYIAPFESEWDIVHTSGTSYFYKDYDDANVRLIVMDAMLYNDNGSEATAQTTWLENLLSDAITNSLHVLIAIHAPHGGASSVDCSFSRYNQTTMPTNNDCNTPQTVIDAVASAITNGLKFIGYLVGHTHQDDVWDAEGDGTQLMYCVTCAAVANEAQWTKSDQYRSHYNDAYNVVVIDTENTLIKIIRCGGADVDDHMRTRKAICFDYSTGTKVGEVL